MTTVFLIDRLMTAMFVVALVLLFIAPRVPVKGGRVLWFGSMVSLVIGGLLAISSATFCWNGHDWIEDGDDLIRVVAAIASLMAFTFLWWSRTDQVFPGQGGARP